jgi:hypothetical protein
MILFCSAPGAAMASSDWVPDFNDSTSGKVLKTIKKSDNLSIEKEGRYFLENDGCSICWEVTVSREGAKITLSPIQPLGIKCTVAFIEQLPLHRKILTEIFNDWGAERLHTLFTGPLSRLEPANTWNTRIALASTQSADWLDWCSNYPNHSSKKSINQIFIELVNQVDACKELSDLFKEFGLKIKPASVEKVFEQKARDLPFYRKLKAQGLQDNPRVIYDVGMMYFSISPIQ